MIREVGNVELFEFCETIPKVQCSECLLYWNQGVIYCSCGHLLVESESSQIFNQWRLDALSIPHYVIRMERPRGARHGKTERKSICGPQRAEEMKRIDGQEEHYEGIHDRFLRDPENRDSQLKIGWTEPNGIKMDKLAQEDHSCRISREEFQRYQKHWYLTLNKSGKAAPMRLRSDFRAAVTSKTVSTENQVKNVRNPFFFNNVKDGTLLPQVILGGTGTRPKAGGAHEFNLFD